MPIQNYPASTLRKAGLNYIVLPPQIIQLVKNPIALAIWCYLQSHSEGWICRKESIKNHFDIGDDKYNNAMKELRQLRLVWTENIIDPKSGKLLDRRIFCSNIPSQNPESEKPTQGDTTGQLRTIPKPSVCSTLLGLKPSLGETHPLINTYKNIINTQRERDTDKFTMNPDVMPSAMLVDSVSESTITPTEFVFGQWPAFMGHNLGKPFSDDELQGAFIKWVGRAWNDFGGESAHFGKTVARLNRRPPRNAQKAP